MPHGPSQPSSRTSSTITSTLYYDTQSQRISVAVKTVIAVKPVQGLVASFWLVRIPPHHLLMRRLALGPRAQGRSSVQCTPSASNVSCAQLYVSDLDNQLHDL